MAGFTFKKIYYDDTLGRAVAKFVPADNLVVPYTATDLNQSERVTHVIKKSENEIRKLQVTGFYRDVDIQIYDGKDQIAEQERKISGVQKVGYSSEEYTLLEIHANLDLPGFENEDGIKIPYIITIDEGSGKVLSIYRNYKEDDNLFGIDRLNIKRSSIPAVTHIDYSARIQTVHKETNKKYYNLLNEFKKITSCPILVNTSFNVRGEPIVCSIKDAFNCFMGTNLDILVCENFILYKDKQNQKLLKDYKNQFQLD